MGKKLNKYREQNKDKMIIGFCLELKFLQELFDKDFSFFISFIDKNSCFFNNIDVSSLQQAIQDFNSSFINFTNLIYSDVDFNELHCDYHKDFY